MHLHLGFRGPLPDGVGIHYSVILDDFADILADNNMVIISIPTALDPGLAPDSHVLHAYYAADEPYEVWEGWTAGRRVQALKAERAAPLWAAVEKIVPDIRERVEVEMVASPLTRALPAADARHLRPAALCRRRDDPVRGDAGARAAPLRRLHLPGHRRPLGGGLRDECREHARVAARAAEADGRARREGQLVP